MTLLADPDASDPTRLKTTLLCVEDEECLREDLAEELRLAGYDVLLAKNGKDGLQQVRDGAPGLVICDISMPVMNGYELLAELRREDRIASRIPVVLMTAYDRLHVETNSKFPPDAIMQKPVDYKELLKVIDNLLCSPRMRHTAPAT